MDLLLDIIRFLKKLQSGQHDIEAGQFELYEGMENMNKALDELKTMKKDVDNMKANNAKQIKIIRDLEVKMDKLHKKYKRNRGVKSNSTTYYSDGFADPMSKKGFKKIHRRIEEVVDITSDVTNDKEKSESSENEQNEESDFEDEKNGEPDENIAGKFDANRETESRNNRCKNSEMLERYLQDSAKYRKMSKVSESYDTSEKNVHATSSDTQSASYYKEPRNEINWKELNADNRSYNEGNPQRSTLPPNKSFCCPLCYKKFKKGSEYVTHKKKHYVITCRVCRKGFPTKQQLQEHLKVHKKRLRKFEGFTCCYCHLVCRTPEKLTAHLRKCRIITKTPLK